MERFYADWNPKDAGPALPAAAALVAAQAYVRAQPRWSHPSLWAAWNLRGALD
jgi:CHAT domain-containing protein